MGWNGRIRTFKRNESGAATLEWVLLTFAACLMVMSALTAVAPAVGSSTPGMIVIGTHVTPAPATGSTAALTEMR